MKTYLLIEEDPALDEPLYLESGPYQSYLPQIGDHITVNVASRGPKARPPGWETKGTYRVVGRKFEVYDQEGTDLEMTCELRVEVVP